MRLVDVGHDRTPSPRPAIIGVTPQAEVDSTHRKILTNFRDLWIGLANARNFPTGAEFDQQVETLNRIQADLIKSATIRIH
jgi:hypothetical protein